MIVISDELCIDFEYHHVSAIEAAANAGEPGEREEGSIV